MTLPVPPQTAELGHKVFPIASFTQVWSQLLRHMLALPAGGRRLTAAILLLTIGATATVQIPRLLGELVDLVVSGEGSLVQLSSWLILCAIGGASASAAGFYVLAKLAQRLIANLREDMVGTALGLPVHRVEEAGTGDLVSRSTDDIAEVSNAVTQTLPILATSTFTIIATVITLASVDWQFLLVPLLCTPLYVLAARRYLKVAPERFATERASVAERARRVLEGIRAARTIRAFSLEDVIRDRIDVSSTAVRDNTLIARRTLLELQNRMTAIECLMITVALGVGFHLVRSDAITVGAVTGALLMLVRLRGPLMFLMRVLDILQAGFASLARIFGVVLDPPQPVASAGAPKGDGAVTLTGVSFSYGGGWAVEEFDLHIPAGDTVALVGASGAGKTTVAALLAGLRVPDTGTVSIDGVPVSALSDEERGTRLAMISQDVHVFSGTLREDLTLAKPDATDAQLLDALEQVQAHWYHDLPDGLDTVVGAKGHELQPVEAQQLALARVLLIDPQVVIMDEATAEAGSAGAGALEAAAEKVRAGRTALIVAHRLDQASQADRILVMDGGVITESGSHEELVSAGGRYSEIWAAWTKGRRSPQ